MDTCAATITHVVYMSAQTRREHARGTALDLIREGTPTSELTLRTIAEREGIPLPTLTYAYRSITDLLDDLVRDVERPLFDAVGDQGLAAELHRFLDASDAAADADPVIEELSAYALRRCGEMGDDSLAADRVTGTIEMITTIREQARERYRLSDETIGRQFRLMFEGAYLHWIDGGGLTESGQRRHVASWRAWISEGIDVIVRAADPKPARSRKR